MLAPYRWISDYTKGLSGVEALAEKMVMTGNGVEGIEHCGENIQNVVVGKIEKIDKHPDADKLVVCQIDVGDAELLQIVTGADNVFAGAYVPVAKAPAVLPTGPIKKGKLRGVESFGMLCSGEELNLKEEDYEGAGVDGIMILRNEPQPGMDVRELLHLSGTVMEFEVGANRPDCLSMLGIAREAAAADEKTYEQPQTGYAESDKKTQDMVSVEVQDKDLCTRYIAAAVTDVKIEPSPEWMRVRLREAGVRPINNIVDITNFVMLETGQPMHAFDAADIRGERIIVRRAQKGEKMVTLDDKEHEFTENMLLIYDAEGPIGIAGIMGGQNSEIKQDTKTVVFEAAKFGYGNVRQTSRALGVSTESSMRFSKGVDAATTLYAMQRALTLIDELGAGKVAQGMIDILNEDLSARVVKTSASSVNALLGTEIAAGEMQKYLSRVFIQAELEGDELVCTIPSFRGDMTGPADVAEEVARIYGYDNIPATDANVGMRRGVVSERETKTDVVKRYLIDTGHMESVTYSFIGAMDYAKLDMPMPKSVKILNPLGDDTAFLRTTLIPHMLNTVATNLNRKNTELKLYEVSRSYTPVEGQQLPRETPLLCIAHSGVGCDFFRLKGVLENIVMLLCGKELQCKQVKRQYLHPGAGAEVFVDDISIGLMGELNPRVAGVYELEQKVFLAEINLEALFGIEKAQVRYKELPRFPAATRDIAVIVDTRKGAGDLMDAIKKAGGKRVEQVKLFDVYEGEQLGEGKKSLAYALTLRAQDGTMTDKEVDKIMDKVVKTLQTEFGAELRS
ncbi:phenylalanine--tRNA ligase subunit beta [Christensenellaceae bacterium OttesenSCG-928-K19]|nr:phenylalanine--tRNA ligase subunit beta [Christensenellaceae bacterium OttesenSCG-928-K19]